MTTKTRNRAAGDPTTWAADFTRGAATPSARAGTRPSTRGASSDASAPTPIATIAGGSCRPAEMAGADTVATPASSEQHACDAPGASLSVSPDTVAIRLPIPNVSADKSQHCEQCGAAFVARRPWARFCSVYCRRLAWLGRNPERAVELAEHDRARLRAHVIGNGREWVD